MKLNILYSLIAVNLLIATPIIAAESEAVSDVNVEVTAIDAALNGESEAQINNASGEATEAVDITGTLIEIGNTTAEETTLIIRTTSDDGQSEDQTLEIAPAAAAILTDSGLKADLSDWIAGDQIRVRAQKFLNSGALKAERVQNRSFKGNSRGLNGWVKAVRAEANEVEVEWAGKIYTVKTTNAKMVAGLKNPAALADFQTGDRVRGRVTEDGDGNPLTVNGQILVVLRRGQDLFMRVTRWVVPAKITALPQDLTLPTTIEAEVLPSKFYEQGDVNNLVGEPGAAIYIDITADTNLRRRYLGKALLSEFNVGDEVMVIGRRDESSGHILAQVLQNTSIQRVGIRYNLGKITAINSADKSFSLQLLPIGRAQTVTVQTADKTAYYQGREKVDFSALEVEQTVKVRGTGSRTTQVITADHIAIHSNDGLERVKNRLEQVRERLQNLKLKTKQR